MDNDRKANTRDLRRDISELSSKLKILSNEKEAKYQTISELSDELNISLKLASELKAEKAKITTEIKEQKSSRDSWNKTVGELAKKMKSVRSDTEKQERGPSRWQVKQLQDQLDQLNMKMQTEVISFEKEQKMMEVIKNLRGQLKAASTEEQAARTYSDSRQSLREAKLKADIAHKYLQDTAAKNAETFKKLSEVSKKIAAMKDEREKLKKEVGPLKLKIHDLNQELAQKLSDWSSSKKLHEVASRKAENDLIEQKVEAVREKLAKKEKLTTEDILAMQRQTMKE